MHRENSSRMERREKLRAMSRKNFRLLTEIIATTHTNSMAYNRAS